MPLKLISKYKGFTLIELLIAMGLNVLLLSSIVYIFSANLQNYRTVINTNRLNQQLQTAMDMMSSDIRRAGYWANAINDMGLDQNNNPFMVAASTDVTINGAGNCITFSYDRNANGTLPSLSSSVDDERYGYRLMNQALQARPWGATFNCTAAANQWENITDTNIVLITNLQFVLNSTTIATGPGSAGILIRSVDITLTGRLANDAAVTKTLTEHVRIRNDKFIP